MICTVLLASRNGRRSSVLHNIRNTAERQTEWHSVTAAYTAHRATSTHHALLCSTKESAVYKHVAVAKRPGLSANTLKPSHTPQARPPVAGKRHQKMPEHLPPMFENKFSRRSDTFTESVRSHHEGEPKCFTQCSSLPQWAPSSSGIRAARARSVRRASS